MVPLEYIFRFLIKIYPWNIIKSLTGKSGHRVVKTKYIYEYIFLKLHDLHGANNQFLFA